MKIGVTVFPKQFDPRSIWNFQEAMLFPAIFQNLVRTSAEGHFTGDLAQSWNISNDGRIYRFLLHKDAKFHDGTPVTADDVVFALSRYFWNDDNAPVQYIRDIFQGCSDLRVGSLCPAFKAIDQFTVEVILSGPYPPLLHLLGMAEFGIYSHKAYETGLFVGSGALIPTGDLSKGNLKLKKNLAYKGVAAKLNELEIQQIPDSPDSLNLIRTEKVDVIVGIENPDLKVPNAVPEGIQKNGMGCQAVTHAYFNMKRGYLGNQEIRANLAILIQAAAHQQNAMTNGMRKLNRFFPDTVVQSSVAPAKDAEKKIELAIKRLRTLAQGKTFRLLLRQGWHSPGLAEALRTQLKPTGMKIDIPLLSPTERQKIRNSGEFEATLVGYVGMFPDPDGFLEVLGLFKSAPTTPFLKEIDAVRHTKDAKIRLSKYDQAAIKYEKQAFSVPLYIEEPTVFTASKIKLPLTNLRFTTDLWRMFWE